MPRMRTIVGFLGGLAIAVIVGLVPAEIINWLRDWSGRPGPDPDGPGDGDRIPSKRRRAHHAKRTP